MNKLKQITGILDGWRDGEYEHNGDALADIDEVMHREIVHMEIEEFIRECKNLLIDPYYALQDDRVLRAFLHSDAEQVKSELHHLGTVDR